MAATVKALAAILVLVLVPRVRATDQLGREPSQHRHGDRVSAALLYALVSALSTARGDARHSDAVYHLRLVGDQRPAVDRVRVSRLLPPATHSLPENSGSHPTGARASGHRHSRREGEVRSAEERQTSLHGGPRTSGAPHLTPAATGDGRTTGCEVKGTAAGQTSPLLEHSAGQMYFSPRMLLVRDADRTDDWPNHRSHSTSPQSAATSAARSLGQRQRLPRTVFGARRAGQGRESRRTGPRRARPARSSRRYQAGSRDRPYPSACGSRCRASGGTRSSPPVREMPYEEEPGCSRTEQDPDGDCIKGKADSDYPTLESIPQTGFSCRGRPAGFYADEETRCQVWHYCTTTYVQQSFLCNRGTVFNQQHLVCDWWYSVECGQSDAFHYVNDRLYTLGERTGWRGNGRRAPSDAGPPSDRTQLGYRAQQDQYGYQELGWGQGRWGSGQSTEHEVREQETREREVGERENREREVREQEASELRGREREAREREAREQEAREREVAKKREAEEREAREREAREREVRERETRDREVREREAREQAAREREEAEQRGREAERGQSQRDGLTRTPVSYGQRRGRPTPQSTSHHLHRPTTAQPATSRPPPPTRHSRGREWDLRRGRWVAVPRTYTASGNLLGTPRPDKSRLPPSWSSTDHGSTPRPQIAHLGTAAPAPRRPVGHTPRPNRQEAPSVLGSSQVPDAIRSTTLGPNGISNPGSYSNTSPRPYSSTTLRLYSSTTPRPYSSTTLRPYSSTTLRPYSSTTLRPCSSTSPRSYGGTVPRPYSSTTERPYIGTSPRPYVSTATRSFTSRTPKYYSTSLPRHHASTTPPQSYEQVTPVRSYSTPAQRNYRGTPAAFSSSDATSTSLPHIKTTRPYRGTFPSRRYRGTYPARTYRVTSAKRLRNSIRSKNNKKHSLIFSETRTANPTRRWHKFSKSSVSTTSAPYSLPRGTSPSERPPISSPSPRPYTPRPSSRPFYSSPAPGPYSVSQSTEPYSSSPLPRPHKPNPSPGPYDCSLSPRPYDPIASTTGPCDSNPSTGPYDSSPSTGPYDSSPYSGPYDSSPATGPYDSIPSTGAYDSSTSTGPYGSSPSTGPYDSNPSTGAYDSSPSTGPYDSNPSTETYDSSPSTGAYMSSTPNPSQSSSPSHHPFDSDPSRRPSDSSPSPRPYTSSSPVPGPFDSGPSHRPYTSSNPSTRTFYSSSSTRPFDSVPSHHHHAFSSPSPRRHPSPYVSTERPEPETSTTSWPVRPLAAPPTESAVTETSYHRTSPAPIISTGRTEQESDRTEKTTPLGEYPVPLRQISEFNMLERGELRRAREQGFSKPPILEHTSSPDITNQVSYILDGRSVLSQRQRTVEEVGSISEYNDVEGVGTTEEKKAATASSGASVPPSSGQRNPLPLQLDKYSIPLKDDHYYEEQSSPVHSSTPSSSLRPPAVGQPTERPSASVEPLSVKLSGWYFSATTSAPPPDRSPAQGATRTTVPRRRIKVRRRLRKVPRRKPAKVQRNIKLAPSQEGQRAGEKSGRAGDGQRSVERERTSKEGMRGEESKRVGITNKYVGARTERLRTTQEEMKLRRMKVKEQGKLLREEKLRRARQEATLKTKRGERPRATGQERETEDRGLSRPRGPTVQDPRKSPSSTTTHRPRFTFPPYRPSKGSARPPGLLPFGARLGKRKRFED